MSANGEKKLPKLALSWRKVVSAKKNVEEDYSNSECDTSSTGSNESEISVAPSKPLNSEKASLKSKVLQVKTASKTLKKKFHRHFSNVDEDEEVLNRYYCALLGDILLQGHLYITENYFAFYSNVFGYVTKILIPIITVQDITKEKTARIVPNAIGIVTSEEKHVFGSLMSRDNTWAYMRKIWEKAQSESPPIMEDEVEPDMDSSEFEEAENGEVSPQPDEIPHNGVRKLSRGFVKSTFHFKRLLKHRLLLFAITLLLILLYTSVSVLLYRIIQIQNKYSSALEEVVGSETQVFYNNLLQWQAQLHSKSDGAVYSYLDSNLDQIVKVKKALEALSSILVDSRLEDSYQSSPEMIKNVG